MLRNVTSNRFKVIDALAPRVKWDLTGTPMSNKALDVSGILTWFWQKDWETSDSSYLSDETMERYLDPEHDIYTEIFNNPLKQC